MLLPVVISPVFEILKFVYVIAPVVPKIALSPTLNAFVKSVSVSVMAVVSAESGDRVNAPPAVRAILWPVIIKSSPAAFPPEGFNVSEPPLSVDEIVFPSSEILSTEKVNAPEAMEVLASSVKASAISSIVIMSFAIAVAPLPSTVMSPEIVVNVGTLDPLPKSI